MTEAAAAWGAGLDDAVLFVGRPRAPLRIPEQGDGVFILNPHQEVFAFIPDDRPLSPAHRRRRTRAGVRAPARIAAASCTPPPTSSCVARASVVLRGVSLHELTLATMTRRPRSRSKETSAALRCPASGAFAIQSDKIAGVYARGGDKGGRWCRAANRYAAARCSRPPARRR